MPAGVYVVRAVTGERSESGLRASRACAKELKRALGEQAPLHCRKRRADNQIHNRNDQELPSMQVTHLLQQTIERLRALPERDQERYAHLIQRLLEGDQAWDERLAATTDAQWEAMIAAVDRQIDSGDTSTLDDFLAAP